MKLKCITAFLYLLSLAASAHAAPLKVCASVPELGELAAIIGGDQAKVTTFVKGQEDPHALVAKPSDVRALAQADAFIILGLSMETGWAPALIQRSRNPKVRPNTKGYIDASRAITPIQEIDPALATRAMGDVHPEGNPHYMLDPVNGLKVARIIAQSFIALRPKHKSVFLQSLKNFEVQWANKAFGESLASKYPVDKLIQIQDLGKLSAFLKQTGELEQLSGWFGDARNIQGTHWVSDHSQWNYFAKRFDLKIERSLEPKAGVPPSSRHLISVINWMKSNDVKGILASAYFPPRTLDFIHKHSGLPILPSAHQVGARASASNYFAMIDHNVSILCDCCKL